MTELSAHPPIRLRAGLFWAKAKVFQTARALREAAGRKPRRFERSPVVPNGALLAESRSLLYPSQIPAEAALQTGKVQNLRVAAAELDGLMIPAAEAFSFWAHVPRPVRRHGYAFGRELREGCIIPSIGGGLCQLSNALYDAALKADCEIIERHAHSRRVPGSMAEAGRDATVFWNYVDLRFRPRASCQLDVSLTRRELIVRLRALVASAAPCPLPVHAPQVAARLKAGNAAQAVESCETCGVASCFRHPGQEDRLEEGLVAWLVDAWQPEFDQYLCEQRRSADWLFLPLDGTRFHLKSYRWDARGFTQVRQAPVETLRRSWASRRLAAQGAARQQALLRFDEALASRYRRKLPPAAAHLVVSQNLLPFLWRNGDLGGRTFDVLMTRLPLSALQATLDRASARHPDSRTLADFRVSPDLLAAEDAALAEARRWITPHSAIAKLGGARAMKLAWEMPPSGPRPAGGSDVLFPASSLGRKGAYELAAAARQLGLRVQLGGPVLEEASCWRGVQTLPAGAQGFDGIGIVALPAWVEHQPRRLLRAVAAGLPAVVCEGCGLADVPGVLTLPEGDVPALTAALARLMRVEHSAAASPRGGADGAFGEAAAG
jgi:hypothetical protein